MTRPKLLFRIRLMIGTFVFLLVLSGITAFPVYSELKWIMDRQVFTPGSLLSGWLQQVWEAVKAMNEQYPILFYGYDWLAFSHLVIGMAFIGPYKDPVKNSWVIDWGMLCCIAIIPLAIVAGPIRHIPWFHILIDCSFGIIGIIPLWITKRWIKKLESMSLH
jgi:hypothetical protein